MHVFVFVGMYVRKSMHACVCTLCTYVHSCYSASRTEENAHLQVSNGLLSNDKGLQVLLPRGGQLQLSDGPSSGRGRGGLWGGAADLLTQEDS